MSEWKILAQYESLEDQIESCIAAQNFGRLLGLLEKRPNTEFVRIFGWTAHEQFRQAHPLTPRGRMEFASPETRNTVIALPTLPLFTPRVYVNNDPPKFVQPKYVHLQFNRWVFGEDDFYLCYVPPGVVGTYDKVLVSTRQQ